MTSFHSDVEVGKVGSRLGRLTAAPLLVVPYLPYLPHLFPHTYTRASAHTRTRTHVYIQPQKVGKVRKVGKRLCLCGFQTSLPKNEGREGREVIMAADDEAAQRNRERFPFAARIVDELRAVFGPDVRPTFIEENGERIGKPAEERYLGTWISLRDMIVEVKPKDEASQQKGKRK